MSNDWAIILVDPTADIGEVATRHFSNCSDLFVYVDNGITAVGLRRSGGVWSIKHSPLVTRDGWNGRMYNYRTGAANALTETPV